MEKYRHKKTTAAGNIYTRSHYPLYTRKLTIPRAAEIKNTAARKTHGTPLF